MINALFLYRAAEDYARVQNGEDRRQHGSASLLRALSDSKGTEVDIPTVLQNAFFTNFPRLAEQAETLLALPQISPLDRSTAENFLSDFYKPSNAPYNYDFFLLSKHALSKVYERYVTLMDHDPEAERQTYFIPLCHWKRKLGRRELPTLFSS